MPRIGLVCLLTAITIAAACAEPVVLAEYQQVELNGTGEVRCEFPRPLADCRIRLSEHYYGIFDTVLRFGQGAQSAEVQLRSSIGDTRVVASYVGEGLASGHCGVRLRMPLINDWSLVFLVECHGLGVDSGWSRGVGLLGAHNWRVHPVITSTPPRVVARRGSDVAVMLTVDRALEQCYISAPTSGWMSRTRGRPHPTYGRYRELGEGADQGHCGAVLPGVTRDNAGVWSWGTHTWPHSIAIRATLVLVKAIPVGKPVLRVRNAGHLRVGGQLNATCRAPPAVPPATITWLLAGREVRRDALNDTRLRDVATSWPWEPQPVVQTFIRRLTAEDRGQLLECRVEHGGLEKPRSVSYVLKIGLSSKTTAPKGLNPYEPTSYQPNVPTPKVPTPSAPTIRVPTPRVPRPNVPVPSVPTPPVAAPGEFLCPPLPTYLDGVRCVLSGSNADCGNASHPLGTSAHLVCSGGFEPRKNLPRFLNTTCTASGWRPQQFACDLDCGIRGNASQLSPGGKDAQAPEFPWHVAVFEKEDNSYYPICGGSLISIKFFVSAAHCYYDDSTHTPLNASMYTAAVGKRTLSWETQDRHEQRRTIRAIHIPEHFYGTAKRLESDFALLELSEHVDVTLGVGTVCVDWKTVFDNDQLMENRSGLVPGWGVAGSISPNSTLRLFDLPFVPFLRCRDTVPTDFERYLIQDKMCGGSGTRQTPVCQGDAGAGYVFPRRQPEGVRYYVRGVLSSAAGQTDDSELICQDEKMATFTLISMYARWLRRIVFPGEEVVDHSYY